MSKQRLPAVEGLFTMDSENPSLIGGRKRTNGSFYFPKELSGNDPASSLDQDREDILLSQSGKVWSYTSAGYPPALPYVITSEPFEPFVIAAVHLEKEDLVVCGQMMPGVDLEDMEIGMEVKLALDTLYEDEHNQYIVWKWELAGQG